MPDEPRPHLVPMIKHDVSFTGRDDGHSIEFKRINGYGERSSSLVVSELSFADLVALREVLDGYLDEGRYQE